MSKGTEPDLDGDPADEPEELDDELTIDDEDEDDDLDDLDDIDFADDDEDEDEDDEDDDVPL